MILLETAARVVLVKFIIKIYVAVTSEYFQDLLVLFQQQRMTEIDLEMKRTPSNYRRCYDTIGITTCTLTIFQTEHKIRSTDVNAINTYTTALNKMNY